MFQKGWQPKNYKGVSDEIKQQHQKTKDMTFKEKLSYFWYYYKIHTFAVIAVIVFLIAMIHDMASNKAYGFYALMLNSSFLNAEAVEASFSAYTDMDTDSYECEIDTLTTLDLQNGGQIDYANLQKLVAQIQIGDIDALVLDSEVFYRFSLNEMVKDLREVFSEEELSSYEGNIYYIDGADLALLNQSDADSAITDQSAAGTSVSSEIYDKLTGMTEEEIKEEAESHKDPTSMTDPIPVGIFVDASKMIRDTGCYLNLTPIYGISVTSKHPEEAKKYLSYMNDPQINFESMMQQY